VLAEKGSDNVKVQSNTRETATFIALGVIASAGQKLPLWMFATAGTGRYKQHPTVMLRHSENRSATEGLTVEFIEWLHRDMVRCSPCALILDVSTGHRSECVFATAETSVLAGGTMRFQPMDRLISGQLKARTWAEFGRRLWRGESETMDYTMSVDILARYSAAVSAVNVKEVLECRRAKREKIRPSRGMTDANGATFVPPPHNAIKILSLCVSEMPIGISPPNSDGNLYEYCSLKCSCGIHSAPFLFPCRG
jgi:hypothetical protein